MYNFALTHDFATKNAFLMPIFAIEAGEYKDV